MDGHLCFVYRICWTLALLNGWCQSLKDVRVSVPQAIRKGETAVFLCDFDLEGDNLYTVKWYKGRREFYRFTPKDEFPIKTFPIENLYVDKSKSGMNQLTLLRVESSLSGIYNCEVSAESPSFHTALVSGEMDVVEVPSHNPVITVPRLSYRVGEILDANCTSASSRPAANLTWFLNGEKVHRDHIVPTDVIKDHRDSRLLISRSRLRVFVKTHSFVANHMALRCSASIHNIYYQSAEKSIEEQKSKMNLEETQLVGLHRDFLEKRPEEGGGNKEGQHTRGEDSSDGISSSCKRAPMSLAAFFFPYLLAVYVATR